METTSPLQKTLDISESFFSLQGESSYCGFPCFFIRLSGCNLRCTFCDARYTYEEAGQLRSIGELLQAASSYPGALVEITGGEPLLQENVYPLMEALLAEERTVLLETNGSLKTNRIPAAVIKIMDLKCPDSGMHEHMDFDNFQFLSLRDEVKFVIGSRKDYDWATDIITDHGLAEKTQILFSPVVERIDPTELADMILADNLPVRLQLQLHKILWPNENRGF